MKKTLGFLILIATIIVAPAYGMLRSISRYAMPVHSIHFNRTFNTAAKDSLPVRKKVCGICKDIKEGETHVSWPNPHSDYAHLSCHDLIRNVEATAIAMINEKVDEKDRDAVQRSLVQHVEKACEINMHDFVLEEGRKSLRAVYTQIANKMVAAYVEQSKKI